MSNQQENFFDAVRKDPAMTPEQKAYWLQFEPEKPVDPEGDAAYWRARAEKAERAYVEIVENARVTINGMMEKNGELNKEVDKIRPQLLAISALLSERHGDDGRFEQPEDEYEDDPEVITIKRLFDILEGRKDSRDEP